MLKSKGSEAKTREGDGVIYKLEIYKQMTAKPAIGDTVSKRVVSLSVLFILAGCMSMAQTQKGRSTATAALAEVPRSPTSKPVALRIRLATPEGDIMVPTGKTSRLKRQDDPRLRVVFENLSTQPLALLDEWNSFGYFNLSVEFTTSDGVHHEMKKQGNVIWARNFPSATTLEPGGVLVRDVWLDPDVWDDVPNISSDKVTLLMKAIFTEKDVPGTWEGTVESPVTPIRFFGF